VGCPALGPGARWTPWHAARPQGASRGANEGGPAGSGCRPWVGSGAGLVGGGACGEGSGMPPPSGQRLPPWGRWEIEAPTARPHVGRPSSAGQVRPSGRGRAIPSTTYPVATEGGNAGRGLDGAQIARSPCRRCALWCRSRAGAGMPGNASPRHAHRPARSLHLGARWENEAPQARPLAPPSQA
jgi:hypothetical protein